MRLPVVFGFLLSILCLVLSGPVSAAEVFVQAPLTTGPFLCANGAQYVGPWTNTGPTMRLKSTTLWMGMDGGGRADYTATLFRIEAATTGWWHLVHFVGWDHYAEPTTHGGFTQDLGADHMTLQTGDQLYLVAWCQAFTPGVHGHVAVFTRVAYY
jgi:hypothetical protein